MGKDGDDLPRSYDTRSEAAKRVAAQEVHKLNQAIRGRGRSGRGIASAGTPAPSASLVDLNASTREELEALPGIGPALARRIMARRPFRSINDQIEVDGIGEAKLMQLRPLVSVGE